MKTITEIELTESEFNSLCFLTNYDNKYNTFLATKYDVDIYLKPFINNEISTDYVLFKKIA